MSQVTGDMVARYRLSKLFYTRSKLQIETKMKRINVGLHTEINDIERKHKAAIKELNKEFISEIAMLISFLALCLTIHHLWG